MKKFLYTFLITFILFATTLVVDAVFTDINSPPNGSNNYPGPIDAGDENQIKNAVLSVKTFTSGVTSDLLKINSIGNVSVNTTSFPSMDVRMLVDGDIIISTLSGSFTGEICAGNTGGSQSNGYNLVRC